MTRPATLSKAPGLRGIQAAIIDLDGTMMDTAPDIHAALNAMRRELGLGPIGLDVATALIGKGSENLVLDVLALDYSSQEVEQHFERALGAYLGHYLALNGVHSTLYPGVVDGLETMKSAGLRLACVTNKPIALAAPLLASAGLAGYFDITYGGDSLPHKKPDPYPMLQVCRDFNLAPHQVVAIGDSSNDARAARAAGCGVLTVPYGYNHGRPVQEIDSDGIVATLFDAAQLLTR
ncbi:MAG: phosphoglycolate phosphatase [Herminiimonas sp.]|nr:phosphoglycolate phosphatase [Herminiimonas sp.]MDB5852480.1 phosphoglycolate phosphatase [Herminiimonas sp.]